MSTRERDVSVGSRPARKKANDDSTYVGQISGSATTSKRPRDSLGDEGDNGRMKRKRVEVNGRGNGNMNISLVEFDNLPMEALNRYLHAHSVVPYVFPSPSLADDPPAPHELEDGYRAPSPPPPNQTSTPANRPRRESKEFKEGTVEPELRRSKRHDDPEYVRSRVPILADIDDVHGVLADIAEQHFREHGVKEVETLAGFIRAVRAKAQR